MLIASLRSLFQTHAVFLLPWSSVPNTHMAHAKWHLIGLVASLDSVVRSVMISP